jgi:uncharacterized protein with HEPN domain
VKENQAVKSAVVKTILLGETAQMQLVVVKEKMQAVAGTDLACWEEMLLHKYFSTRVPHQNSG